MQKAVKAVPPTAKPVKAWVVTVKGSKEEVLHQIGIFTCESMAREVASAQALLLRHSCKFTPKEVAVREIVLNQVESY